MRVFWIVFGVLVGFIAVFYIIFGTSDMRTGKISFGYSDYRGAIDKFQRVLIKEPNNAEAHLYLGLVYGKKRDYEKAFEELNWLKKNSSNFPIPADVHNEIGMFYYLNERYADAIIEFKRATELNPKFKDAYFNLGTAYSALNDLDNALSSYRAVLKIDPRHAYSHWNVAVVLEKEGDIKGAVEHWEKYAALTPGLFSNPEVERHISELKRQIK